MILRATASRAPTGVRNAALLSLLAYSGLRVGEALALQVKDLERGANGRVSLNVRRGKGARQRAALLFEPALPYLDRWLDTRRRLGINGQQPLFCTLKGGLLSDRYVRQAMCRYAAKAGISKRCHPHALRHTFSKWLHLKGVPAAAIQHVLGHESLATTTCYLNSFSTADIQSATADLTWEAAVNQGGLA